MRFSIARTGRRAVGGPISMSPKWNQNCARALAGERDRDRDRVVAVDRFLDEADDLVVVDLREAQIAGLQQRRVARAAAG